MFHVLPESFDGYMYKDLSPPLTPSASRVSHVRSHSQQMWRGETITSSCDGCPSGDEGQEKNVSEKQIGRRRTPGDSICQHV